MTAPRPEGWVHRGPRPLILWGGFILVLLAVTGFGIFLWRYLDAVATAAEHSAHSGTAMPDMTGGIPALLSAAAAALATAMPIILNTLTARNRERRDQIALGGAPPPFDPSPAEGGPRPGDSP